MDSHLRNAWRFFYTYAGYTLGRRAIGAWKLALAERHAASAGITFEWDGDYANYHDTLGDHAYWCRDECKGVKHAHEVLSCVARDEAGKVVAALGGIIDPSRAYARVVEAELAIEALSEPI